MAKIKSTIKNREKSLKKVEPQKNVGKVSMTLLPPKKIETEESLFSEEEYGDKHSKSAINISRQLPKIIQSHFKPV